MNGTSYPRKINFRQQYLMGNTHRSGWADTLKVLGRLHHDRGVFFDGFMDTSFAYNRPPSGSLPYRSPWIGFIHCPQNMPGWFQYEIAPQTIFKKRAWIESLPQCRGIYCLSDYHRKWLVTQLRVPVANLVYPTETPELGFSMERFSANRDKKIVQIGWWLRRFSSIFQLPTRNIRKVMLHLGQPYVDTYLEKERALMKQGLRLAPDQSSLPLNLDSVEVVKYLPNDAYDRLLSENIAFMHLYDTSANTAIIECIVRATPLLINPLAAAQEYLGPDYPFYFSTLEEAARMAEDTELIAQTHDYLKNAPIRERLTHEYFLRSFMESEIYRGLPEAE